MPKWPRSADPRKVIAALERIGWEIRSTQGSHEDLVHDQRPGIVLTVPFHPGSGVSPGALRNLLRRAGITVEEFVGEL